MAKPKRHDDAVQHSSLDPNWRTPPGLFSALHLEFAFQLDLAANAESALLDCWLGPDSPFPNALKVAWAAELGPGTGFLNPPYSRERARECSLRGDSDGAHALDVHNWAAKAWMESQAGFTTVGIFPYSPQTEWFRQFVMGHQIRPRPANLPSLPFHAAKEVRRFPHRVSFLRADGSPAANAGGNSCVIVWAPMRGTVAPWVPGESYWTWRGFEPAGAEQEEQGNGSEDV